MLAKTGKSRSDSHNHKVAMELPEHPQKNPPEPLLAAWIKWTMDFWEALAQMGPGPSGAAGTPGDSSQVLGATEDCWHPVMTLWQAFFSLLSEPATVNAVYKGIKAPSEMILKMAQAGWGGYFQLYQQWLAGGQGEGPSVADAAIENLDQAIFTTLIDIYEDDFRQSLNLPQLGVTLLPQERINQATDRFEQFQAAMAEFIYLLYLPLKKSLRAMPGEPEEREAEKPPEDFKEYYKRWLRMLEGSYMTLFKSPEYTRTMSHALEALEDFTVAKQELLADALVALRLPSNRDLDEVYREIYLLRKTVKELSKKLAKLDPAT
jgi:polyhydroxyalkanoate synthase subunit PhaE